MCFFFFLLFVEIPCEFSFGVGVGLRNSICIFLERFCNLVTNRKSGRVQCLIDVGRWKVRSMCPASAGWWEQYFCSYRRNCTWYGKSATTPIISFFRGENADFWAHRGGISSVSKVSNNGGSVWWCFAWSFGATCKSFPVFFFVENNIFQSAKVLPLFQHTISGLLGVISRMVTAWGVAFLVCPIRAPA